MSKKRLWNGDIPYFEQKFQNEENMNAPYITDYIINDGKKRGCVIIFPGGGYTHRALHEGEPIAKWLNEIGINAFVVDYRVSPYMYPAALNDAVRAVKYVKYNACKYNIDTEKVSVMGFSAGAHLACLEAIYYKDLSCIKITDEIDNECAKPHSLILCYPVVSFSEDFSHKGSIERLIGEDDYLIEKLSCEKNISSDIPPVFIWHTAEDKSVPVENSLSLAAALSSCKVPFELHIFPYGRHGLGITKCIDIDGVKNWSEMCKDWLKRQGY